MKKTVTRNAHGLYNLAQERAREKAGDGWDLLGATLQEGLVAREALAIMAAQERLDETNGQLARWQELASKVLGV